MKKMFLAGVAGVVMAINAPAAFALGGPVGGGPVVTPINEPGDDPSDGGDLGGGVGGTGPTSGGPTTPVGNAPIGTPTSGSGSYLFTLDSLPTGPSGTQAFYQPAQQYGADFGFVTLPSAQGGLNQTVNGLTLSLRTATADYANGTGVPATSIRVENDSTNFGYLGVPASVGVGILGTTFTTSAPGAIYANFDNYISYFSVDLYRLSGGFTVSTTLTAYSGLNGTGSILGTIGGSVIGGNNYATSLVELANINGAQSVGLFGASSLANYNNITANLGTRAPTAAVPEPATWAMMLMGFGMIGFGMRSRRKSKITTSVSFA